jgi:hypothetical protein
MKRSFSFLLAAAVLATVPTAFGSILRLNLDQMVAKVDGVIDATIVGKHSFRIDHPVAGPEMYFTTLTLQGRSLEDGRAQTLDVTILGGFVDENNGVWNSEAPSADDQKVGNHVVVFHKWLDNLAADVACNTIYAAHGGLFRVVEGSQGPVVLGRGEGYAVENNVRMADLGTAVRSIRTQQATK